MDPVSIAASSIAFIGACRKLAVGLKFLRALSKAPEDVLALTDELNDLRNVLKAIHLVYWAICLPRSSQKLIESSTSFATSVELVHTSSRTTVSMQNRLRAICWLNPSGRGRKIVWASFAGHWKALLWTLPTH